MQWRSLILLYLPQPRMKGAGSMAARLGDPRFTRGMEGHINRSRFHVARPPREALSGVPMGAAAVPGRCDQAVIASTGSKRKDGAGVESACFP
jgi:hypothetical protein